MILNNEVFWVKELDEHLLVLDKQSAELHVLNPTASVIFLLLVDQELSLLDLISEYKTIIGNINVAEQDIASLIKNWQKQNWLSTHNSHYTLRSETNQSLPPSKRAQFLPPKTELPKVNHSEDFYIKLQCRTKCLIHFISAKDNNFPDAIPRLKAILAGLETSSTETDNQVELTFLTNGEKIYVKTPEYVIVTSDESFGLSSLATAILQHSYHDRNPFATIHAAALGYNEHCIILPGSSGSGKSTLSGYLAAKGWEYFGDDVVALGKRENKVEILPFCTSVGLKPGSWEILKPYYPQIDKLPVIPYADRKARFIKVSPPIMTKVYKHKILFPKYTPSATTPSIIKASKIDALKAIINSGLTTGLAPNSNNLECVLDFLGTTDCYFFSYNCLTEAGLRLEELCHAKT